MRPRRKRRGQISQYMVERQKWKLSLLREFVTRHGWAKLKPDTVVVGDVNLYRWVVHRRSDYRTDRIPTWLAKECEEIPGWSWSLFMDAHKRNLNNLRTFVAKHGWDALFEKPVVDGVRLDKWVAHRRDERRKRTLDRWLIHALDTLPGWTWDPGRTRYERTLRELREHVAKHGWSTMHETTVSDDGVKVGHWAGAMRARYRRGELDAWIVAELVRIPGWTWDPLVARQQANVERIAAFVAKHGWDTVTYALRVDGVKLGNWISNARTRYRRGILATETAAGLEAIPGWSWTGRKRGNELKDECGRFAAKPRVRRQGRGHLASRHHRGSRTKPTSARPATLGSRRTFAGTGELVMIPDRPVSLSGARW